MSHAEMWGVAKTYENTLIIRIVSNHYIVTRIGVRINLFIGALRNLLWLFDILLSLTH